MTPARWGGEAWGGSSTARPGRPPGVAVPGYDAVYYWTRVGASPAWGQATWAGRSTVQTPSAGLLAAPDPADLTVTIWAWWAFAPFVAVTRIDADGTRTPVRGSPLPMPSGSRRNDATNPKARDTLTGYAAGSNTTLSRLTDQSTPIERVTTGVRSTATAAGIVSVNAMLDTIGAVLTPLGFLARTSAVATDLRASVTWYDGSGTSLGTRTYSTSDTARTQAATGWTWCDVAIDSWPLGALTGTLTYQAVGLPAGGILDVTARLLERRSTVSSPDGYFDGDFRGAAWIGTPGISGSDLAPIVLVVDAEAPLDTPVRYELTSAAAPGYVAASEEVVLPSDALYDDCRQALLTHPGLAKTIRVWIREEPELDNDLAQGVFRVKGRRNAVVVSDSHRGGDEGELVFVAESIEERTLLMQMLDDGSPLLVRSPAEFGHPPLWWLSFGKARTSPLMPWAPMPVRLITVPFVEVDRPSAATRPLVA